MKKIFKNITFSLMIGMTLVSITYHSHCDVFELEEYDIYYGDDVVLDKFKVSNQTEFEQFIKLNGKKLPDNAFDPFTGAAIDATQMLGYAVFFPEGNMDLQQMYVAKKRQYMNRNTPVINYKNADTAEKFMRTTPYDHTERQLIAKIINNYRINGQSRGTLCIYTYAPPCRDEGEDNNEMCCIDYYKKLAAAFSYINFKVYFSDKTQIITKKYKGDYSFFSAIARIIKNMSLQLNVLIDSKKISLTNTENINFGKSIWEFSNRSFQEIKSKLSEQQNFEDTFNKLYNPEILNNLKFYVL